VPPVEMFLNRKLQVTVTKKVVLNFCRVGPVNTCNYYL